MEIINGIHLCMEFMDTDKDEAKNWGNYVKEITGKLRDKIAELDKINGMNY